MVQSMYIVTMTLLCLNLIVAVLYYSNLPKIMLRRMPTTLANVIGLFESSVLVAESARKDTRREKWKLGVDGKSHVGSERRPFVIPWGDG